MSTELRGPLVRIRGSAYNYIASQASLSYAQEPRKRGSLSSLSLWGRRERIAPAWYNSIAWQAGFSESTELRGPLVRIRGFPYNQLSGIHIELLPGLI